MWQSAYRGLGTRGGGVHVETQLIIHVQTAVITHTVGHDEVWKIKIKEDLSFCPQASITSQC